MNHEYQVLLVDDEPLALEGVKASVNWGDLGFTIAGECADGEEAFVFIKKHVPDLVITDLRMPSLDGLNLIEQVVKYVNPKIKFIVISGYDDFTYAQRAMKYQVNHYLLKPVFPEEIALALQEIREHLDLLNLQDRLAEELNRKGQAEGEPTLFPQVPVGDLYHLAEIISYLDVTLRAMEEFNLEKVEKTMEDTFSFIKARDLSLEIGKMFAINLMYHSNRIIREMDGTPSTALPYCNMACIEKQVTTMDELQRLLGEYVKEFFAYANELKERDAQNTIYRIEEYINPNFESNHI